MLNRKESMQVISDNYEIIEKIETHMKVVDLWVERSGSELWKGMFGIPIAVLFILVLNFVAKPILDIINNDAVIIITVFGLAGIAIYYGLTLNKTFCEKKAMESLKSAVDIYQQHQQELSFLPDFSYCREATLNYLYNSLSSERCSTLNEALDRWDADIKHREAIQAQKAINDKLNEISRRI